jgi:calcium/calmodulin-dependent protein kinase (CaM kinase) II
MDSSDALRQELLLLTRQLLDSIAQRDWATYQSLCDPSLTAFEPEAVGHLVEGLEFHQFHFQLKSNAQPVQTTIASPHVRLLGDVAVVSYVRLIQRASDGGVTTVAFEETRVWQRGANGWKHVHFHRSIAGG